MIQEEFNSLRSQIVTSKGRGGTRFMPMAFTEQGIAMLSTVLNSKLAIEVNIQIIRKFVQMRKVAVNNEIIMQKIDDLIQRVDNHDEEIEIIIQTIEKMLSVETSQNKKMGFSREENKYDTKYETNKN